MAKLSGIIGQINKDYGEGIARQASNYTDAGRLPTGVFAFDLATGGGFPLGRTSIIYGPESSGKTNLALLAIVSAQRLFPDKQAVFVDLEQSFDADWARQLGVDLDKLVVINPEYAEQAVDLIEAIIYADDVSCLVVDSLAAMITSNEVDSSAEKAVVGGSGLVIGRLYRKTTRALGKVRRQGRCPACIFINQIRIKVGVMYGDPETMPGGNSFKYASSLTVRLYGKNVVDKKIHPTLPAFKDTSGIIKKYKVPIVAANFEYNMSMIKQPDLAVGECADWNTISNYLKDLGLLVKSKKGWLMLDQEYKTLEVCKAKVYGDQEFGDSIRKTIIDAVRDNAGMEPDGDEMVDEETGEIINV